MVDSLYLHCGDDFMNIVSYSSKTQSLLKPIAQSHVLQFCMFHQQENIDKYSITSFAAIIKFGLRSTWNQRTSMWLYVRFTSMCKL